MLALKKAGYKALSISDFYDFMFSGKKLPEKSILITFDDGPKTSYYPVDAWLKALGYRATSYIITRDSFVDVSRYYLTKKEVKKMSDSGRWDIQFHTKDGHNLYKIDKNGKQGRFYPNKLWIDEKNRLETDEEYILRVREDLTKGNRELESLIGKKIISFAFPFGDYGQNQLNFSKGIELLPSEVKKVFPIAFYQVYAGSGYSYNYPDMSEFMMRRIIVRPEWNGEELINGKGFLSHKLLPDGAIVK